MIMNEALRAYETAATHRSQREQEADVFRRSIASLKLAQTGSALQRIRALADNRRLWTTVSDLMRDPGNALPADLRASIISVAITVQREMDQDAPDLGFLIAVNENVAMGLAGGM